MADEEPEGQEDCDDDQQHQGGAALGVASAADNPCSGAGGGSGEGRNVRRRMENGAWAAAGTEAGSQREGHVSSAAWPQRGAKRTHDEVCGHAEDTGRAARSRVAAVEEVAQMRGGSDASSSGQEQRRRLADAHCRPRDEEGDDAEPLVQHRLRHPHGGDPGLMGSLVGPSGGSGGTRADVVNSGDGRSVMGTNCQPNTLVRPAPPRRAAVHPHAPGGGDGDGLRRWRAAAAEQELVQANVGAASGSTAEGACLGCATTAGAASGQGDVQRAHQLRGKQGRRWRGPRAVPPASQVAYQRGADDGSGAEPGDLPAPAEEPRLQLSRGGLPRDDGPHPRHGETDGRGPVVVDRRGDSAASDLAFAAVEPGPKRRRLRGKQPAGRAAHCHWRNSLHAGPLYTGAAASGGALGGDLITSCRSSGESPSRFSTATSFSDRHAVPNRDGRGLPGWIVADRAGWLTRGGRPPDAAG